MSRDELKDGTKVLVEAVVSDPSWYGGVLVDIGPNMCVKLKPEEIHPFPGVQENRDYCHECKYSEQLDLICEILQKHHWIGKVKAIGRMEAVQALQEVLNTPPPSSAEQGEGGGR